MAFTHVLIPTDFSEPAQQAVRYALEEATVHHASVTLLHVLPAHTRTDVYFITGAPDPQPGFEPALERRLGTPIPSQPTVVRDDHYEAALTQLRDIMPASFQGPWDADVVAGPPAETIVRVAYERGADLIVMGTHGRTGLAHVLLGSVAEKVVRLATCPVLTVRYSRHEVQSGT
jgi:nucleotide-binding universal stress UspA family protein